jgi:hypothetical protein
MRKTIPRSLIALALAAGTTLASGHAPNTGAVHAAPASMDDPCTISFPDSAALRAMAVGSGPKAMSTLRSSSATFSFGHFTQHDLNADVKQLFGITLPKDDTVGPFTLTLSGGRQTYVGLVHTFQHGPMEHVCLRGIAYRNLGNGAASASVPPTPMSLDGIFARGMGAVTVRVDRHAYSLKGYLVTRQPM